jgi:KDO2-lipid IV(A) lauroyltransferase
MAKKKPPGKISSILQEYILRVVLSGVRIIPKMTAGMFCSLIYFIVSPLSKKDRRKIERNIDKILSIPGGSDESRQFQNQVLKHQIASGIESFKSGFNHNLVQVEGLDEFDQKIRTNLEQGRGLIITTGHLGSWEILAYYSSLATGNKFNALAKPSKLEAATHLLNEYRLRMNTKTLWTNQRSLMKSMVKTLKDGEALGFAMDQRPDGRKGPIVNFWGQPTSFAVGPAWASVRNGSPVMGLFCMRIGPWKYRLIATDILPADHGETDTEKMTQKMASEIERVIRLYPEQWVWNYSRWQFK